jgi:uncharacterized protein with von Willebrand factor type A (vWA) domain
LRLPIPQIQTRRLHPDAHGRRVDLRATLRASLRGNADIIALRRRSYRRRHPPLVVLCDISGSMSRYSRMFLHFCTRSPVTATGCTASSSAHG